MPSSFAPKSASSPGTAFQRGGSLVSLLVALVLSMLSIVAAMHAYRTTVVNARLANLNAREQSVAATLSVQLNKLLPQAGWGLRANEEIPGGRLNVDLVLLEGASFSKGMLSGSLKVLADAPQVGTALVWATAIEGGMQCFALASGPGKGLSLMGPKNCADANSALSTPWDNAAQLVPVDVYADLQLQVQMAECWPFGGSMTRRSPQVELLGTRNELAPSCLANIQA